MRYISIFLACFCVYAQDNSRLDEGTIQGIPPVIRGGATTINGVLGAGSIDWPSTQGQQTGRLNRNAVSSLCGVPKACDIFLASGARDFDAYEFFNTTAGSQCVNVMLDVQTMAGANYQVNAYLNSFDPANICTSYLADPGVSSGSPPSVVTLGFDVPPGDSVILVVHTTNPGEVGGDYILTVDGDVGAAVTIPTLSQWGLGAFLLLITAVAVFIMRRNRNLTA